VSGNVNPKTQVQKTRGTLRVSSDYEREKQPTYAGHPPICSAR
jgi:hypothetical protein